MATDAILPVQLSRRRTADPSRRQRILQERRQGRAGGEREERDRRRDEREEEHQRRAASLSHHTPSHSLSHHTPSHSHSHHHHSPMKRRKKKEREHQPLEEEEEAERPDISAPDNAEIFTSGKPLPSDDILNALFGRLMDKMRLAPERVAELNMRGREYKWSLILAQHEVQQGIACVFYVEQLVRHAQPELKEKRPKKKLLENLQPLGKVLSDLEVDLRTNPNDSWVDEFVSNPNHGHVALIDLIKDLADHPTSVARKNAKKYAVLNREPSYLYNGLLCLKALMGHRTGFSAVLGYDPSLCVLAYCLDSLSARVKVLVLKLMVTVLLAPGGHKKVMQAFDYFRAVMKERTRFQLLMSALVQEPVDPAFQAAALCFINTVVQTAHGPNSKVFHQHEFLEAGFSPEDVEKSLHGRQDERVLHELREWRKNFIDIQQYMDDLAMARGRARNLKEELETAQRTLYEMNIERENQWEQIKRLLEKTETQRDKILRLNENINELLEVKLHHDELVEENQQLAEANRRYRMHTTELKERMEIVLEENKVIEMQQEQISLLQEQLQQLQSLNTAEGEQIPAASVAQLPTGEANGSTAAVDMETTDAPPTDLPPIPPAPPPPPIDGVPQAPAFIPPPPPIGGGLPGVPLKKPVIPNVPLPMLNWMPIKNPDHTIFKDLNDESVLETVDFSEFEAMFQVKRFEKGKKQLKREENLQKLSEQLHLIESRRARNLVIAKRRIGQTSGKVISFILNTDLDGLQPEHCELLLKFIPTQEELSDLEKHAHRVKDFAEADRFMFDLATIERYESRLTAMAYMGNFDDLFNSTQPLIDAVLSASLSVFRSSRLKKIFEIILAFGNYMNSSRRGAVHGFKLESLNKLADTRSTHDKKQTLLHYIVHVVETVYPHQLSFYDDLDIEEASQVSNQILAEDVQSLRKGLEEVKLEKERDPDNFILFSFYLHAYKKVQIMTETYAKMEDAYREVCLMFSESPKTMEPSDFFGMFRKFIKDWKQALQENHEWQRRRKRALASSLLKKPENEEEAKETMADLAAEAAAAAASRKEHIIEETQKLSEHAATADKSAAEEEEQSRVETRPQEDIYDIIKEKGVHHLDLKARLPWLREIEKRKEPLEGEKGVEAGEEGGREAEIPAGEGTTEPVRDLSGSLSEHSLQSQLRIQQAPPTDHTPSGSHGDIPVQVHNGGMEQGLPSLPPKDYPSQLPDLPPRDYPTSSSHTRPLEQTGDLLTDNDYYTQMMNTFDS